MLTYSGFTGADIVHEDAESLLVRAMRGDRPVLLRTPRDDYPTPDQIARLRYGCEVQRGLDLPGVARVIGLERRTGGWVLVLEDFGARSLKALMASRRIEIVEALDVAMGVVRALADIHARRVVHKNVCPASVLVSKDCARVVLDDFGIASRLDLESPTITSPSRIEGALPYISPEQTGRMNRRIDYRTDFYSLGATLYEMLTGRPPFVGVEPMTVVHGHIALRPVPPHEVHPAVPRAISAVVMKLLAKNAEERYQSTYGLLADLRECRAIVVDGRAGDGFVPGRHDVSAVFRIPQKLYGRERETTELIAAFERASRGTAELVVVSGYSGIGKSSLVNEIHKPIVARRGYFAAGKFDQLQNAPYSALIRAFQSMLRQILAEQPDQIAAWARRFHDALGDAGQVVADVIPELSLIMGGLTPVPALGSREAENRFNLAFLQFIGVIATPAHPLALFLDDLHWADTSSLRLLELLLGDPKGKSVLVIGAYRDNEVHAAHPLMLALAEIRKVGTMVSAISLRALAPADVGRLVADALGFADPAPAEALSTLVFEKTVGNPFFVIEFLKSLHQRGLVAFDAERGRFAWSLDRIMGESITDNVAHLMAERIRRMPASTQAALRLAACIGNTFELSRLAVVREASPTVVARELWEAVREGLINPVGHAYRYFDADSDAPSARGANPVAYSFAHDRVQEASLALIPEGERKAVHLRIGRLLLEGTPEGQREARIFDIVNQLDMGAELITAPEERAACARLNLLAARKAKESTAYGPALRYLAAAEGLLGEAAWSEDREAAYELYRLRAECEHLTSRFADSEATFERLLAESRTRDEKVAIHKLEIGLLTASGKFPATWKLTRDALHLYGVDVPDGEELRETTARSLADLRARLDGDRIRALLRLPESTDPDARERIHLLSRGIAFGAYMFPDLYAYEATTVVELSMEHGNAVGSGLGYVGLGLVMASAFDDGTRALALAEVGVAVAERFGDPLERVVTSYWLAGFVGPWGQHLRKSLPILRETYAGALKAGALHYVGLSALQMVLSGTTAGEGLAVIQEQATQFTDLSIRGGRPDMAAFIATFVRYALLLRRGEIPADASEWHDEDFLLDKLVYYHAGRATYRIISLHASLILDEGERTFELADKAERELVYLPGHQQISLYHLARVVLGAQRIAGLRVEDRPAAIAALEPHHARLAAWAAHCPENFLHLALLTEAEIARVEGEHEQAAALYDRAIAAAAAAEYVQHEALAGELAARFHLARGRRGIAAGYLLDARDAYARWGADAKVSALVTRYPELYGGAPGGEVALDVGTVLRASQAISGEIVLADLLRKLMSTVLENAGAERGVLLLKGEGGAIVEATKVAVGDGEVLLHTVHESARGAQGASPPFDLDESVAASVVRYVERTGESVVLADAAASPIFRGDAYVQRRRPRSVLCLPVRQKSALVGTLYLENNLVRGAFTPQRCKVLEMLASQAAISIENALLYDTLDRRVKERTAELSASNQELSLTVERLQETQRQLIAQERLASLGALTAGIAHEIKNPLNFVSNFAKLSIDLTGELREALDPTIAGLDPDTSALVTEILDDLRLNMGKIASHGDRANQIINGMLLHARKDVGARQEVDLNGLLAQSVSFAHLGLRAKDPSFEAAIEADYDPAVGQLELSATDMRRLFINLVNNACYAVSERRRTEGPRYTPTIRVGTRSLGDRVEVRIRDNGTGIPKGVLDKIFDPFFTTKPPGEGTGLGLSISYDIVQGHHGEIRVDTEPGDHTELIVVLPRRARGRPKVADAGPMPPGSTTGAP